MKWGRTNVVWPLAAFLIVVAIAGVRTASEMNRPGEVDSSHWVFQDFRDAVYYPVVSFIDGHNPYATAEHLEAYPVLQPYSPYSPLFLLAHLPFGLLPHLPAQLSYAVLTLVLILALSYLVLWACGRRAPPAATVLLLAALILASRPGNWNFMLGQTTVELVLAVYVAQLFAVRSPWLAGVALAAATMKPTFGGPLLLLMVVQRYWRAVVIGVGVSLVMTLIPTIVLVTNSGGIGDFLGSVSSSYRTVGDEFTSSPVISAFRVDTVALVSRITGSPFGATGELVVFLTIVAIAAMALVKVRREATGPSANIFCTSIVSLAILIASYQQPYSALLLVLPLTALVLNCWVPLDFGVPSWTRKVLILLLVIPGVNYGASWKVTSLFETGSWPWIAVASINGMAILAAFLVYVAIAFQKRPPSQIELWGVGS